MEKCEIKEIKRYIKKVNGPRKHEIKNSLGVYDAYKYIRKNQWFDIGRPLTEKEFYSIIRMMNRAVAEYISKGYSVILPCNMGALELRKREVTRKIENGKFITNMPVDWDRTLMLWAEDEESMLSKTLIRCENKDIYQLHYVRSKAKYNNKSFYEFKTNRELKHLITRNAKEGNLDSFLLYKKYD